MKITIEVIDYRGKPHEGKVEDVPSTIHRELSRVITEWIAGAHRASIHIQPGQQK